MEDILVTGIVVGKTEAAATSFLNFIDLIYLPNAYYILSFILEWLFSLILHGKC